MYTVHCTVYTVHCALYPVCCTLWKVERCKGRIFEAGEVESYECDDHTIFIRKMLKSCLAYAKLGFSTAEENRDKNTWKVKKILKCMNKLYF